jgi:hypothetical protein
LFFIIYLIISWEELQKKIKNSLNGPY